MSFFAKPTSEGMILGFESKELGNVHLTIFSKDGRIFSHITDFRRPLRPWNLNFDEKLLARRAERMLKRWVRHYSANKIAWVMTSDLRRKLVSQFPRQKGRIKMPVEMAAAELVFDRHNPRRWHKVRIPELLSRSDGPGLTVIDRKLHWVQPFNKLTMLAFTDRQFEGYWSMIFKELGIEKYLAYVMDSYPEVMDRAKAKVTRIKRKELRSLKRPQ